VVLGVEVSPTVALIAPRIFRDLRLQSWVHSAFAVTNASLTTQSPSQTVAAVRYYYGTPAACTGCMGK